VPTAIGLSCPQNGSLARLSYPHSKGRRGGSRATIATAHAIVVPAYHMLDRDLAYQEPGDDYFHRRGRERADRYTRCRVRKLERLGHHVTLEPATEAA
jgi:transposase